MKQPRHWIGLLLAPALPGLVHAQQPPADEVLEVITVTAQKREQSALEVPLTVTAYDGAFLEQTGIEEFNELSDYVPGLVVQEQSVNNPGFVIRGITSDSGSAQIAPRVSIYQDGVDISRSRGSIVELHDLERVEVLKGPQATLFGSGASIGAISLISARPTEEPEAELGVGAGDFGMVKTRGYVAGPLGEDFGGRFAWIYKERDGYIENIDGSPGSQQPIGVDAEDLNGTETLAVRGFLTWTPTDALALDLILNYQEDTPSGTSFKSGTIPPTGGTTDPNSFAELGPHGATPNAFLGGRLGIEREVWSVTLQADYEISDAWSLTSITNRREFDSLEVFDADGTAAYWLEFAEDADGEQYSQELRVNFDSGERFAGFAGVSFFHEEGRQGVPFSTDEGVFAVCSGLVPGVPCVNPDGSVNSIFPAPVIYNDLFANTGETDTWSVYLDGTWALTDRINITAGVRYVYDEKKSGFLATGNPSVLQGGAPLLPFGNTGGVLVESDTREFDDITPRLLIDFAPNESLLLYASIAEGRRANVVDVAGVGGAANPTPIVTVLPEEKILSYDAGIKGRFGNLFYDAAVFYQEYEDFQTSIIDTDTGDVTPVNAGEATNAGFEGSLAGELTPWLSFFVNLGYIDAQFDDTDSAGNPQAFAGNRFRLQPEWTASAGLTYRQELGSAGSLFATLNASYRSDVFFEDANAPIAGLEIAEDDVQLANLRLGYDSADDRWSFEGYVSNLFDKDYIIDAGNTGGAFGTPTFIGGPPRMYGIEVTWRPF
ncbi:MAG TPA: TonB-dependent receptor [Woeseiaceae bacterium]|nr:TonB-dependent receptor [Woeseiaceae bacterium]